MSNENGAFNVAKTEFATQDIYEMANKALDQADSVDAMRNAWQDHAAKSQDGEKLPETVSYIGEHLVVCEKARETLEMVRGMAIFAKSQRMVMTDAFFQATRRIANNAKHAAEFAKTHAELDPAKDAA